MSSPVHAPEYCPRPTCIYFDPHRAAHTRWYSSFGSYSTSCRGTIRRFRCKQCGKTCSTQTFSIHYWTHSSEDHRLLLQKLCSGSGLRQHARCTTGSLRVVRNRLRRLSRNCLFLLDTATVGHTLGEDLAIDGFESFTRSQYFPNNITICVGSGSQYIYAAVHTLLRRKGSMTCGQREIRAMIDRHWRPAPKALQHDVTALLADTAAMIARGCEREPRTLCSDYHHAYPPALRAVPETARALAQGRLFHHRTSSRAVRTRTNPLFPVNYTDRQIRNCLGEHVRETLKHGREVNAQMERMAIFMVAHNFLTPHRITDGVNLTRTNPTRADVAGIPREAYRKALSRLFTHRSLRGHLKGQGKCIERVWAHRYENPPAVNRRSGEVSPHRVALSPGEIPRHLIA